MAAPTQGNGKGAGQEERDPLQSGKVTAPGNHPIGTVGGDPTMAASSHTLDLLRLGRGPTRARTAAHLNLALRCRLHRRRSPGEHLAIAAISGGGVLDSSSFPLGCR